VSQQNVDKARDFISAYNRRDFDAAVESFDPEIEWVLPAAEELGGTGHITGARANPTARPIIKG